MLDHMLVLVPTAEHRPDFTLVESGLRSEVYREILPDTDEDKFIVLPHPADTAFISGLRAQRNVRAWQVLAGGVDHLRGRVPPGIDVYRAPHLRGNSTAEVAVLLTLAGLMRARRWFANMEAAQWEWQTPASRVAGRRVAILGNGFVGASVGTMMKSLGADTVLYGRRGEVEPLDRLREAVGNYDVVIIALPLTPETESVVSRDVLFHMKPGALLVNVSRGKIVDANAMFDALESGRIWAALDVTEPEPLPAGHAMWSLPNVIISPHIGGNVELDAALVCDFIANQARAIARGGVGDFRVSPNDYCS